ncbi:unnamed protein product [Urochloa decumbens]|uniref:GDSL esterase/lipase n=1 Tax=Urochloa decumbens TaxID=240449 RepID=A0ABC8YY17_9POAL
MRFSAGLLLGFLVLPCLLHGADANVHWPKKEKPLFPAIFSFGDSYADTGNYIIEVDPRPYNFSPYGVTFGRPTGRASDGLLPVDYVANGVGLPFVPPYLDKTQNFSEGANFAVIGARALDQTFFLQQNITFAAPTNSSLSVQLRWFEELRPSLCNTNTTRDCGDYLGKSLFFVGEIGGNDYLACLSAKTVEQTKRICVPAVIKAIAAAAEMLIRHGARRIVLPGNVPMGCLPAILTFYPSPNVSDYDSYGCLRKINALARYHNELLWRSAQALRIKYPDAKIAFADYYDPVLAFLTAPALFGFDGSQTLVACCGGGGKYNFNAAAFCGFPGATACADPSRSVSWDGIHLTQPAFRNIAKSWLLGPFAEPPILSLAPWL